MEGPRWCGDRSLLMGAATLAGMPVLVLIPFFADDIFHRGSQGLGFLMGAMGIGAVVGTLVLARRTRVSGLPQVMVYSGFSVGASFLVSRSRRGSICRWRSCR